MWGKEAEGRTLPRSLTVGGVTGFTRFQIVFQVWQKIVSGAQHYLAYTFKRWAGYLWAVTQGAGQERVKAVMRLWVAIPSVISDSDGLLQVGAQVFNTGLDVEI